MGDIRRGVVVPFDLVRVMVCTLLTTRPSIVVWLLVRLLDGKHFLTSCEKGWAAITLRRELRQLCFTYSAYTSDAFSDWLSVTLAVGSYVERNQFIANVSLSTVS